MRSHHILQVPTNVPADGTAALMAVLPTLTEPVTHHTSTAAKGSKKSTATATSSHTLSTADKQLAAIRKLKRIVKIASDLARGLEFSFCASSP